MTGPKRVILSPADRELYEATGNGMHAWVAYRRARQNDGVPDEWVLEYFDRCYRALAAEGGTSSPKGIANALQLRTKKGGDTARDRAITAQRRQAIVTHIRLYRRHEAPEGQRLTRQQSDDILYRVATECGLSYDRVRTIWFKRTKAPKVSQTR